MLAIWHSPNLTVSLPILNIPGSNAIRELDGHRKKGDIDRHCRGYCLLCVLLNNIYYLATLDLKPEPHGIYDDERQQDLKNSLIK